MSIVVNARTFNPSKITYEKGKTKEKTNRTPPILMKYGDDENNKQLFQIVLPLSNIRLLSRLDEKSGETVYTLTYTLTGCDTYGKDRANETEDIGKLYNSLLDLEELTIKTATENSVSWFGKKRSEESIRESFNRIVRVSTDNIDGEKVPNGKYPPSWWIKIPVYKGKVSIDNEGIVDSRGHPIEDVTPSNLQNIFPNNSQAKLIVTGKGYVINGGGFGISWTLKGAQVLPTTKVRAAELFAAVEDEDSREHVTTEPEMSAPVEQQPVAQETTSAPARKKRAAVNQ